jgi:signal transduction histidine kinase
MTSNRASDGDEHSRVRTTLEGAPAGNFDAFTELASLVCEAPVSLLFVIEEQRVTLKSKYGAVAAMTPEMSSFCARNMSDDSVLVVEDARADERLASHPCVQGAPHVRFCAWTPLRDDDGARLGSLCVFDHQPRQLESTQLRALELISRSIGNHIQSHRRTALLETLHQKLHVSNEHLTTFMRAASHDIRGPLRTIMLMAEAVQSTAQVNERGARFVSNIHEAARRARRLVDDLLTHASVDASDQRVSVDLKQCVAEACADLGEVIAATGADISVAGLPVIRGSSTAWLVIMKNLIENAIKYTPKERAPSIRIVGRSEAMSVSFDVIDNACGIEPASVQRIFEPLVRLHASEVPGSGIGLATVLKLLSQMGGTVTVSAGENVGSVFRVWVPVND